ncbi:alpha-L-fucosidase [Saccharibacillus alkalitolerans]|uniref:alpha-L-fucosidase n=1 Tax=Saccharibacillus alkalitolerans TaxID=2705290 RepID=A0ABX0F2H1_9BACL|nr:alpha-L-fucosidase [Saccharibacillus alkalitolerans]NGZ74620.1 alpha-L-fucosidase [Saccharibacillus alkalitolerans]
MNLQEIAGIAPSPRQLSWQRLEFYGFIHFGMNTMTGREWGEGHEDPALFAPKSLDADDWIDTLKSSGMRAVILTCKHHDGFCLWPSRYSAHTVARAPWRDGKGDLVREVSDACRRHGLKFGVYLSPWDRTESSYGEGAAYDDFYVNQLSELLTQYGEIGCVWLDGANGEGGGGKKQSYDWDRYYEVVRRLQPNCVISVCGPDIRWVGNEAGHTRAEEWSVVPAPLRDAEKTAAKSQRSEDAAFSRSFNSMEEDLGSRKAIEAYDGEWIWYPAEVNTSIRPGWFYHPEEDGQVRSGEELFGIYLNAVGGNATFLLNVPPNAEGRIAEPDRQALKDLGERIARLKDRRLTRKITMTASSRAHGTAEPQHLACSEGGTDEEPASFWRPRPDDRIPWVEAVFAQAERIDTLSLGEYLPYGQRIESFEVEVWSERAKGGEWEPVAAGGAVGYGKILSFAPVATTRIRITFTGYREFPTLSYLRLNKLSGG